MGGAIARAMRCPGDDAVFQTSHDARCPIFRGARRLWRCSNPDLSAAAKEKLMHDLMSARRAVRSALATGDKNALAAARRSVEKAKVGLGERGPVWWTDGSPDLNRHMARNTSYAGWFAGLGETGE